MRLLVLFFFMMSACVHAQVLFTPEQQANQARLQQMQHEIEMVRLEAQTDRIRMQTELLRLQIEQRKAENANEPREKSISEIFGEYEAKKATEEAHAEAEAAVAQAEEERAEDADRASARSADTIYLSVAVTLSLAFGFLIARRAKATGGTMKHEEKFGVVVMISALLLGLLALSISDNWMPRLDALQNLMLTLKIRFFPESDFPDSSALVDIYTKHVLLGLAAVAAYGFTTYLGITPAWKIRAATPDQPIEPPKE